MATARGPLEYRFEAPGAAAVVGVPARLVPAVAGVVVPTAVLVINARFGLALVWLAAGVAVAGGHRGHVLGRVRSRTARATGRVGWRRRRLVPDRGDRVELPGSLAGLVVEDHVLDWPAVGPVRVGVIHDRVARTLSAFVEVKGHGFELAGDGDRDDAVAGWGAALAPFASARSAVTQVVWHEWSRPVGLGAHREFLEHRARPDGVHRDDYEALLEVRDPWTIAHQTLVGVSVDLGRVAGRRSVRISARTAGDAAREVLVRQLAGFASRLSAVGLVVSVPLPANDVAFAVRARSDPSRLRHVSRLQRSLATAVGHRDVEWGPMSLDAQARMVRVDGSWHRSWRAALLPLLPVRADWLGGLLTSGPDVTRSVTTVFRPVPARAAQREVSRQLTSLEAEQEERVRQGFRIKARDRRKVETMEERERELAAGHPEFEIAMVVTVTATSPEHLEEAAEAVEDAAGLLDLRPLDYAHDRGLVASLPLGRITRGKLL